MRVAHYIAELPPTTARLDLSMAEALERLQPPQHEPFDRIVIAPALREDQAAPRLMQAVITAAVGRAVMVVLLIPSDRLPADLVLPPSVHILQGPPFRPVTTDHAPVPQSQRLPGQGRGFARRWPRNRQKASPPQAAVADPGAPGPRMIAIQPMAGGVGGTMLAVNLAVELARAAQDKRFCLLDLNPQSGNVGTYLNLPGDMRVMDVYRNLSALDGEAFQSCLHRFAANLTVFPAPHEIVPLDALAPADTVRLLAFARDAADVVIVDLPHFVADWSGAVYSAADRIIGLCRLEVRSAQNTQKLIALFRGEGLPVDRLLLMLNGAPEKPDRDWQARLESFAQGMGMGFAHILPQTGDTATQACDGGRPLADQDGTDPLRRAIRTLAGEFLAGLAPAPLRREA